MLYAKKKVKILEKEEKEEEKHRNKINKICIMKSGAPKKKSLEKLK